MWKRATPAGGCTPGWSTVGTPAARGTRGVPLGPCPPPGPAPYSRGFHNDPLCGSTVAAPGVQGHCRLSRVGDSVDGLLDVHAATRGLIQDPALRHLRSVGRRVRPRVSPRATLRHRGRAGGAVWGTSLRRCSGPVSTRGRSRVRCPPAAQVPRARLPWGAQAMPPGRSPCPRPLVGGLLRRL